MRRLRSLLCISIFQTLVFPQWALSKLPLSELNEVLPINVSIGENYDKLHILDWQLWEVMKLYEGTPNLWKYQILILSLRGFMQSLREQEALVGGHIYVMDEHREDWQSYERELMKECKALMVMFLNAFKGNYIIIENTEALHLMDKAIEVMEDSIKLTDKLIEIFVN